MIALRPATMADAAALVAVMAEGFEGYRGFAPPDWEPQMPPVEAMAGRLAAPTTFCLVAEEDGAVAGHVSFLPSGLSTHPEPEDGLAHLWQMFVRPPHFGSGLAGELLARAVAEARTRGYSAMRLFTPAGQARARRFYEREGWSLMREFDDERLGLRVAEYRQSV
ncbi:MAG TPA: GNAT family N-acetyltransferase [Solirubrobacteraceae bacterium]